MGTNVIRLGIIGGGAVVETHHWPVLHRLAEQFELVALARRDQRQAQAFARKAGISRVYADYHRLLCDPGVNAVLIAVPIELNGPVLLDAIRAGKHVLAEKPVAATLSLAQRVIAESAEGHRVVLIGENFRYRSDLPKAKSLLQSGAIGTVFAFQLSVKFDLGSQARRRWVSRGWRKESRHRGGFILDAGVHPVAALRDVLGEVNDLSADLLDTSTVLHGPDSLLMQMRMKSGAVGQCFFCYTSKEQHEIALDFSIFGSAGALRLTEGEIRVTRCVGGAVRLFKINETDGGYSRQWENFRAAIRGEQPVKSTAVEAYRDLLVIDAALRSSSGGRRARIQLIG